ncbi:hypothetical protein HY464_00205 [Candidatus Peregrinibacteria bacterium]|nr:hypothetical protein [Candidatus Peregrinibacteria bacterium]MBI4129094.1 hypothetical protein [Candidatus Peregrinibacteria bacterium]
MDALFLKDTLGKILHLLNMPYTDILPVQEGDFWRVDIVSPHPSRLIGWHGETLNSVQHLLKSIVRTKDNLDRSPFLVLDVDGYRKAQEDNVRRIAEQKADFVRRTGSRIALAPMSPYFRRIVHLHVANTPALQDLTTFSHGEGEYRQIVLKLKEEKMNVGEELTPILAKDDGLENLDV